MKKLTPTRAMVYAAGRDAGRASMRKAGRTKRNRTDYNAAALEFARLIKFVRA